MMDRHEPLNDLIRHNSMNERRDAEMARRRADAEDRARNPQDWEDVADPGLEWLGPVWRRVESE